MQVNSSFSTLPISLPADRDSRSQQEAARERLNTEAPNPANTSSAQNASTNRVEAAQRSSESRFQRVRGFDELPLQSRTALNAYLSTEQQAVETSPSPTQLAGIDVFV